MTNERDYLSILQALRLQDGGLVEIYVLRTRYADWRQAVESLQRHDYAIELVQLETGESVDFGPQLFGGSDEVNYRLKLHLEGQVWTSNFFSTEYIDLQGDPRDITSVNDINNVVELMKYLNAATAKSVIFVAETLEPESIRPYISIP